MIELHQVETGELQLHSQPFSIRAVVADVLQACSLGGHGDGGVRWVNESEVELPEVVEGDPSRVGQIIQNLGACARDACCCVMPMLIGTPRCAAVTNAQKFSRGSLTRVTVTIEEEPPAQLLLPPPSLPPRPVLRVDVADRGVGLSPEECHRMFMPFEHAAPEQARHVRRTMRA